MSIVGRPIWHLLLGTGTIVVLLGLGAVLGGAHAGAAQAPTAERIHLKFKDGTSIRLRGNRFVSLGSDDLSGLQAALDRHRGTRIERLFDSRSEAELDREKRRIEARSGRKQPDKNLWYRLLLRPGTSPEPLIRDLSRLAVVETAYSEPRPAPPPVTPDFTPQQNYREAAPTGVDADYAATVPGGIGENVRIVDIEYDWNQSHEDVSKAAGALIPNKTLDSPFGSNNHGTAVIGELVADDNGLGVTGIAHGADLGLVNANNEEDGYDLADAIDIAHGALGAGDVIIIEQQVEGANGGCTEDSQEGCVAVEWVRAYYDAIVSATDDGITVLEAAGNGNQNLDDTADYGDPFPRGRADSGAIVVGAGAAEGCSSPARGRLDASTYGSRVNLQGWGECVVTTGYGSLQGGPDPNAWYTNGFGGTSGATPIVTGAAAILSSVAEEQGVTLTPTQVRSMLVATGTPQDTSVDTGHIGPLPNLRAALAAFVPDADAGGPYVTPEGTSVTLDGAGSSDPQGSSLTYAWDLDDDGEFDDSTSASPIFDRVGRDGMFTVSLRVTDPAGASGTASTTVEVTNVAPTVGIDPIASQPEGTAVSLSGTITDPGWLDTLTVVVDWGDGVRGIPSFTREQVPPDTTLTYSHMHVYGDNGVFLVEVCGNDLDVEVCATQSVSITNVDPSAAVDETGTTLVNGVPTFIASAGEPLSFGGRSQDPGSDDLSLSWDWGDGGASPDVTTAYFANPPLTDPFPSPTLQPRDVVDTKSHTFSDACFYTVSFSASDDDGGASAADTVAVVVGGNATQPRNAGYWQTQYQPRPSALSLAVRVCYLTIVGFMSTVFDEQTDASTGASAFGVLSVASNRGSPAELLDRQLLSAWLNLANGGFDYGELVDTNRDRTPDTAFSTLLATAEAVRLNPSSTAAQLLAQKDILERINGR